MASQVSPPFLILICLTWALLISYIRASAEDQKVYIVYMGDCPKGDVSASSLHTSMLQEVVGSRAPESLLYSYERSFNGFVAKLTEEEKEKIARMEGVVSVFPNGKMELHTTKSWDFMAFTQEVPRSQVESDIIIGVFDSGIWPESDSFDDTGFGPAPSKWKGSCQSSTGFTCNNKIIGAKYFHIGGPIPAEDYGSPRDRNGHGTHVASIAAGRVVNDASLLGFGKGTARGGVPSARIAVYKVCWTDGCSDADILAAFDEAIANGVDIISISVGRPRESPPLNYFEDTTAIGAFHAMKNGILTSNSAGNSGPFYERIRNYSPWSLSVAASTIDRMFVTVVQLGNTMSSEEEVSIITSELKDQCPIVYGGDKQNTRTGFDGSKYRYCTADSFDQQFNSTAATIDRNFVKGVQLGNNVFYMGVSINTFDVDYPYPLVYAGDVPAAGFCGDQSKYCKMANSLDIRLVNGKIVLCEQDSNGTVAFHAGAVGTITSDGGFTDSTHSYPLPASYLGLNDASEVFNYIRSTSNPTAIIKRSIETKDLLAPYVASFSSRGPNPITRDILKPDLTAPGVYIVAAWSQGTSVTGIQGDPRVVPYNIISGTSMACPHVTAVATYVKSFNPAWSPAAVKSALMTTALPMSNVSNPDAEFAYGAGHIDPLKAVTPGLVYDAGELNYVKFLCGQGYSTQLLQIVTGDSSSTCSAANTGTVWDLNYPTFALTSQTRQPITRVFHRTVTNVGSQVSTYRAIVTAPTNLQIQVVPDVLTFNSLGQTQSFVVNVTATFIDNNVISGSLLWTDDVHQVRSPIVAHSSFVTHSSS